MKENRLARTPAILIADDEPEMLILLCRVLELEGYRVMTASDGASALNLAAGERVLSLVILELETGDQRSVQVCRALREFSNIPVIIVAAEYGGYDRMCALEAGADDFVTEPVGMTDFLARVRGVFLRRGL